MFDRLKTFRQIAELESDYKTGLPYSSDVERRSRIPIAVIDDEPFVAEQTLRNNGYDINFLGDIRNLQDIAGFNIILCDLQGVGKHLNSRNQGGYIIDEIKRNHPEKFVIAYTGGASDDNVTRIAQEHADFFLKKDADVEEWRDKLDAIIKHLSDPVSVWKRQRFALVDADVPTMDILKLEDAYVKSIDQGQDNPYRTLVSTYAPGADVRAIAQSLVASGIFKILVG